MDFDAFAVLLLLLPFPAALLAPLISRETGRAAGWILAIVPAGLFVALTNWIPAVAEGPAKLSLSWVPSLELDFNFTIDGLSLVFGLLITGIGTAILIYAGEYLREHRHRGRLLGLLLFFMGSMLGLVFTDSLVALFAFWELTALASFLLIGFDHERVPARRAAMQALIINAIGGLALIAGGILLRVISGSWDISGLDTPALRHAGTAYPFVLGFIALAAFTKSAQWPFHFWLPGAMEAPTPVSAYLHSATMVQAGIYLLARLSPLLSGTPLWQGLLGGLGALTLLWGGTLALHQTDLKQMLAQTTIAALGLMVLLLGIGGGSMAMAVAAFFVAHALYKGALFLVAGMLEKGAGTRDIIALGGLRDDMSITFICAGLAGFSMFGLPPFLGWFGKEAIFAGVGLTGPWQIAALVVLVLGNAMMGAIALAIALRPFLGQLKPTPKPPVDPPLALWIGAAAFGLIGFSVVFAPPFYAEAVLGPMAAAMGALQSHFDFALDPLAAPLWLSVITWALAIAIYWWLDAIRAVLSRGVGRTRWSFDRGFDHVLFSLVRFASALTRLVQHGRLELYLVVLFGSMALVLIVPFWQLQTWPDWPDLAGLSFYEWGAVALALAGTAFVVFARSRLLAIIALGIQGLALALIFTFFGAPDLGLTQLVVEVLSVVVLALVMTRLRLSPRDPRPLEDWLRDGAIALICGTGIALLLVKVLQQPFDNRLGAFFASNSAELAHGRNIVNVILVDFRGLDTLGEISVVMGAAIAAVALLRHRKGESDARGSSSREEAA